MSRARTSVHAAMRAVPAAARTVGGRFLALPPVRRRVAVGLVVAVVTGAGVVSAFAAAPEPASSTPTAVRTADRASRGEARPTTTTTPTSAPTTAAPTAAAKPAAPKTTKAPAPHVTATAPKPARPTAVPAGCSAWHGARLTACTLLPSFGFSTSQMSALNQLWAHESGWSTTAYNPSGAYGIPQALPGSKMATAGGDWRTNPATQIRWGLSYIKGRYGSPAAAWSYWQSHGWY